MMKTSKKEYINPLTTNSIFCMCFCLLISALSFNSCGEYEVLEHNKFVKKQVDSLYRAKRDSLVKYSDSICNKKYDSYVQSAYDSILEIRIKEIEKLIEQ